MYSLQTSFVYTLYIYIYNLLLCISLFIFYISSCYANRRNITAILCKYIYINIFIHIAYILGKNKYAMVYAYTFIYILRARKVREVFFLNVYGRNLWRYRPEPAPNRANSPVFLALCLGDYESHYFETKTKG